jgi:hypothetical protein
MNVRKLMYELQKLPQDALVSVCRLGGGVRLVDAVLDTPGYYDGAYVDLLPADEVAGAARSLTGDCPQIVMLTVCAPNTKAEAPK